MRPEDFRRLLIKPGTQVSLAGEYGGPSTWEGGSLYGALRKYLVVERDFTIWATTGQQNIWDTAAVVTVDIPLRTRDFEGKEFVGSELLLLHRQRDSAWDNNDPDVQVFGVRLSGILEKGSLALDMWRPHTARLAGAAILSIE